MKKIVFIALSLTILSLAALPLSAQMIWQDDGNGKGEHKKMCMHKPFMHFNKMQEKLGLTDNQVDKMYNIHKDYMDKFYQNKDNPDKIKELKNQCREEIKSVLTPEQKAKWDNFAKDKMKKGNGDDKKNKKDKKKGKDAAYGSKKGGHGHMGMKNSLGLSNEQSDKIFKIHKDYMDKFYQNRKDEKKVKELNAQQFSEIQNVLTPEQKAKWEEMKKNRQKKGDKKK